jgi:hypothetical protein
VEAGAYLLQLLQRLLFETSFLEVVLSSSDDLFDDLGVDCALYCTMSASPRKGRLRLGRSSAAGALTTAAFDILSTEIDVELYQERLRAIGVTRGRCPTAGSVADF